MNLPARQKGMPCKRLPSLESVRSPKRIGRHQGCARVLPAFSKEVAPMKDWLSRLLFLFAGSNEQQLRRFIEWKQAEIDILRARVPKQRISLTNEERERLLELGGGIGNDIYRLISIVRPRTYERWAARRRVGGKPARKRGRRGTSETLRQIVVRLARETGWGYGRLFGEFKKLAFNALDAPPSAVFCWKKGSLPVPSGISADGMSSSEHMPRRSGGSISSRRWS